MKKSLAFISLLIFFVGMEFAAFSQQQRFPKPEFESGYTQPVTSMPVPRDGMFALLDVLVLIAALSLITWFILKKRSRTGVVAISIFSILYFGFFREGCVCSVGSVQNVVLALFNPGYHIPLSALAFFVIPLIYTLFFGRTFCAGVCPLGAVQDVFLMRPVTLKKWLQKVLGLIPFIYLGLSVLYAATATDFIICRYDPFVGIFRFNATFFMFAIGAAFLLISIFIARPYCRFFCPYGVILNLVSRVSKNHLTITPSNCIQCRLCESSCPLDAINKPVEVKQMEDKRSATRRFILLSLIIPALMIVGGWTGANFHENLAKVNSKVRLADEMLHFDSKTMKESLEIEGFRTSGKPVEQLYLEASNIVKQFYYGGWILGAFIGLVIGLALSGLSTYRYREDYTPDKGDCVSCARCLKYCPVEKD
ncbi:4Fe-4S binding protein [Labilibaculum sp. A4]|uniref:4Fe-4S binding protein n=1 Tax=Labilibaculum euxinus TaxID=2686357 RepID=UPI000F6205DE|nr:4Fe-4S binding protein [Labilibaculum euxinus]MDQ1770455.1 4Fe-4S binding protein [Labilibaculum euxinus]MWN75326.1 4Fe-4S binding protein [Labilibaculum euxinus]